MAKLSIVTAATGDVVTVDELKTHARIDAGDEDSYLAVLLDTAESEAEAYTWRKFLTQTWDQHYDDFADPLVLRYPPVASITSVTYTDTNGDSQTLATSVYELGEVDGISVVRRKYNQTWPSTRDHADVVKVRFVCGYGDATNVPERIKQAIRVHAAWGFRNREGQSPPDAFYRLLDPYRVARPPAIGEAD